MLKYFKLVVCLLVITNIGLSNPAKLHAETYNIILAHAGEKDTNHDIASEEFAKRVREQLGDRVTITVAGNGSMGDDPELLQKLQDGKITLHLSFSVFTSVDDVFGVFHLPYLIRDRAHMVRVRQAIFDDTLQPAAKAKGYRILALWELGFRHIANNIRPIQYPSDMKGLRIRVPKSSPWSSAIIKDWGAVPVEVGLSQIAPALESGQIDGEDTSLQLLYSTGALKKNKYLTLTYHGYSPLFLVASEKYFSQLPQDIQDKLTQIAVDMEAWSRETGEKKDQELLENLKGKILISSTDLFELYFAASTKVYPEYVKAVPGSQKLIDRIEALAFQK